MQVLSRALFGNRDGIGFNGDGWGRILILRERMAWGSMFVPAQGSSLQAM